MRTRAAAAAVGIVFGVTLSWTGLSSPVVLRQGLLFEKAYLFLLFGAAVTTAFVGLRILAALRPRALLTGERVAWTTAPPQRRHVVGSVVFGVGWGVADACPGPIATQLGQGVPWSVCTAAGLVIGVKLFLRREARAGTGPEAAAEANPRAPALAATG
jgi:uncharacterized membrane protein YedE/YeeE